MTGRAAADVARRRVALVLTALVAATLPVAVPTSAGAGTPAAVAAPGPGAPDAPSAGRPAPQDAAPEIRLLTFGAGDRVWEKFGHNALWIRYPAAGRDVVYNWGIFDFEQEDFFARLLTGRMRYRVARSPLRQTLRFYRNVGRSIRVQRLRLTPERAREVARRARVAHLPANRHYAYDPFRDNCSTRIRDLLDRVLDGALRARTAGVETGETYRSHTRRLLRRVEWAYAGIMALLGSGTDRHLTAWDEMFLPVRMDDWLQEVEVKTSDGDRRPLATASRTLHRSGRPPVPAETPGFRAGYLAGGIAGGALLAALGLFGGRGRRAAGGTYLALSVAWSAAAGSAGIVAVGGWALTGHWYVHLNENVLQLQPLSLLLAAALPLAPVGPRPRRAARALAWSVGGLAVLGLLAQLLPGMDQVNGEILALTVPLHLGTAAGLEGLRPALSGSASGSAG